MISSRTQLLTLVFLLFGITGVFTNLQAYNIEITIKDFSEENLYLGYYYGNKQYIRDTAKIENGSFSFTGDDTLRHGMYLFILPPDNRFIQFLVSDDNQNYIFQSDVADLIVNMNVEGNKDTELFYSYLKKLNIERQRADSLSLVIDEMEDSDPDKKALSETLDNIGKKVNEFRDSLIVHNPNSLASAILSVGREITYPEFEGTEEEKQQKKFLYFRDRYFDDIDLTDPRMLRSNVMHARVENYVEKLTLQIPDSVNRSIDFILDKVSSDEEIHRYFLSHFINKYIQAKVVGFDAVFVHLVDNHIDRKELPWLSNEQRTKLIKNASDIKPVLIGKTAPDVKLFTKDKTPVNLHEIDADYTVMYFWDADCGHCKKSIPKLIEFGEVYIPKGVKVIAVCTEIGKDESKCWEAIEERNMDIFLNLVDPYMASRYKTKFDVKSTPMIYVLDRNKKIVSKRIGSDQLPDILDRMIEQGSMDLIDGGE